MPYLQNRASPPPYPVLWAKWPQCPARTRVPAYLLTPDLTLVHLTSSSTQLPLWSSKIINVMVSFTCDGVLHLHLPLASRSPPLHSLFLLHFLHSNSFYLWSYLFLFISLGYFLSPWKLRSARAGLCILHFVLQHLLGMLIFYQRHAVSLSLSFLSYQRGTINSVCFTSPGIVEIKWESEAEQTLRSAALAMPLDPG